MAENAPIQALLEEMRALQQRQIALQEEMLAIMRASHAEAVRQGELVQTFRERAEHMQSVSTQVVGTAKRLLALLVPLLLVVALLILWRSLRYS